MSSMWNENKSRTLHTEGKKKGGWEIRELEQRNANNHKLKPPILKQIYLQKYTYVRLALYSLCF